MAQGRWFIGLLVLGLLVGVGSQALGGRVVWAVGPHSAFRQTVPTPTPTPVPPTPTPLPPPPTATPVPPPPPTATVTAPEPTPTALVGGVSVQADPSLLPEAGSRLPLRGWIGGGLMLLGMVAWTLALWRRGLR